MNYKLLHRGNCLASVLACWIRAATIYNLWWMYRCSARVLTYLASQLCMYYTFHIIYSYSAIVHYCFVPSTCTVPMFYNVLCYTIYACVNYWLIFTCSFGMRICYHGDFPYDRLMYCLQQKSVATYDRLYCNCCHRNVHKNCTGLWGEDFEIATQDASWFCVTCIEGLLTFKHFDNDTEFLKAIDDMSHHEASVQLCLRSTLFNPFEMNEDEHEILDYEGDLDPDKYYFNHYSYRLIKKIATIFWKNLSKNIYLTTRYPMKPSLCYI